ncbi:unnamed protein product [Amoebophrya sp. A120]|nr:unnamed protein product [Amoebophrya sp. A120]|eukprot:GSA120T00011065001.1
MKQKCRKGESKLVVWNHVSCSHRRKKNCKDVVYADEQVQGVRATATPPRPVHESRSPWAPRHARSCGAVTRMYDVAEFEQERGFFQEIVRSCTTVTSRS